MAKSFPVEKLKNMVLRNNGNKYLSILHLSMAEQTEFNLANELGGEDY